ncbi:MAG: Ig-like domain-containing protein, partial [Saprospiraceae bacterium]|nr:Ig-like domain-containing protein [Saprospiraceae bacterium]
MKSTFLFLAILICNISLSAADSSASLDVKFICNEVAYFIAPTQQNFAVGDDVYVKVDFNDKRFVRLVKLYIGHQLIRLDNAAPFEWGVPNGSNDTQLRNMPAGNYSLTAEVV